MAEFDEEGLPMAGGDDDDLAPDAALFENKKISFYVIDGGRTMLTPSDSDGLEEEEAPFKRAANAVYQQLLKIGVSTQRVPHHMAGVIVANTANSVPAALGVDRFCEVVPLDFVSSEGVGAVKELALADDIDIVHSKNFGGYGEADFSSIILHARRVTRRIATSNRQLSFFYITNNPKPFGLGSSQFKQAERNIKDLREAGGDFSCLYIGDPDDDLEIWRHLDETVSCQSIEELESNVYQKSFAPRPYRILPLELGPGVALDVGVYILASEAKRPTAFYVDQATEQRVETRSVYRVKEKKGTNGGGEEKNGAEAMEDDDEFIEKKEGKPVEMEAKNSGTHASSSFAFRESDRARSELKQAIELGGEKIVFEQDEIKKLKTFRRGLVLLGFKPITALRVDRHVEPSRFLYPNEKTTTGSRRLFRALLDRCAAREQMMLCYLNYDSGSRPRLVALLPSKASDASSDGFHMVVLPLADDCVDGRAIEKEAPAAEEETPEQAQAARALVKRLTTKFQPYENPVLQSFYGMLTKYATGEKPREVEDTLKPFFENERALSRAQPQIDSFVDAFGGAIGPVAKAPAKRAAPKAAKDADEAPKKARGAKASDGETIDLIKMARDGKLGSLTVVVLKAQAELAGIDIPPAAKKKEDIVKVIVQHLSK